MTKKVTRQESTNGTTSRGTVKGHHPKPGDNVQEGGVAPMPTEGAGAPKGAASKAYAEGAVAGENTSTATEGAREKAHAADVGATKTQSGRGHRKHQD